MTILTRHTQHFFGFICQKIECFHPGLLFRTAAMSSDDDVPDLQPFDPACVKAGDVPVSPPKDLATEVPVRTNINIEGYKEPVPVLLLTGYLGSGKTTLVNHILTAKHGYRCAVLLNEIGDTADIEKALVKEPEVRMATFSRL